jgi:hypothetical protein
MKQLQARGIDVVHVRDVGLARSDDAAIFDWARRQGRVIVTRNYQDFAPLVAHAARQQLRFPGVLFCAPSLAQSDVGGHVSALEDWLVRAREAGTNPVESTFGWLQRA